MMNHPAGDVLIALSEYGVARLRLAGMFAVLMGGLLCGYYSANRLRLSEHWAKKIMTLVLICFNAPIALMVIWKMNLTGELIWLPLSGAALLLTISVICAALFYFFDLPRRRRMTLVLAASLSNLGYTGGAFVCYALFGFAGLARANLYIVLWVPLVYVIFFPLLKIQEIKAGPVQPPFPFKRFLDFRMLPVLGVITAITLNLSDVSFPNVISNLHLIDIFVYSGSSLAFFSIGLRVKISRLRKYLNFCIYICAVKFIVSPVVAMLLIELIQLCGYSLTGFVKNVIMIESATSCAVLMVTMSNVFDLDGPLASALWVVTTAVFAAIVVPIMFFIFT